MEKVTSYLYDTFKYLVRQNKKYGLEKDTTRITDIHPPPLLEVFKVS